MLYITIISVIVSVAFLIRFLFMKREIRSITSQLKEYIRFTTTKKVDLSFYDKEIESLAVEINHLMDRIILANSQKRRTENELKQAVANISHDLRTPMTSIFGYIQLLESDDITSEERREYIAIIKNRTKRLQVLLNDFFELAVIESIDYHLKLESLKMNNLVAEVIMGFYDQFTEKGLHPKMDIPEEAITMISDESAVKRVIENLVVNAIKHTSGNISIQLEKQNSTVLMTISNDATFLTESDLDLLFNRFYTADQTRLGQGTGLGLSIAKSLMEKMNGKLTAELKKERLYMKCEWL